MVSPEIAALDLLVPHPIPEGRAQTQMDLSPGPHDEETGRGVGKQPQLGLGSLKAGMSS